MLKHDEKRGPFGLFQHQFSGKITQKIKGIPLGDIKNSKKSLTKPQKGARKVS